MIIIRHLMLSNCSNRENYQVSEPLSQIANSALLWITRGQLDGLPKLAMTGLLNDFQYAWLRRFNINYKFEMLALARRLCSGEDKAAFKGTGCKSIKGIRNKFSVYIRKWHADDDRLILSLSFDGKKLNAE
ncbi:MAG: hypothetical protein R6U27_07385 [Desulfobacterales bacterium]